MRLDAFVPQITPRAALAHRGCGCSNLGVAGTSVPGRRDLEVIGGRTAGVKALTSRKLGPERTLLHGGEQPSRRMFGANSPPVTILPLQRRNR